MNKRSYVYTYVDVYVCAGEAEQMCYSDNSFIITVVGGKRL